MSLLKKEVEMYLQMCCEANMEYSYLFDIKPGELSWIVKAFNWSLIQSRFQTITLKGRVFKLEIWDEVSDDRIPVFSETVPSDISLEQLHIKLRDAARFESVEVLERFLLDYHKEEFDKVLAELSPEKQKLMRFTIESIESALNKLKIFCTKDIGSDFVVQLVENDIEEGINSLRAAK
jgi:hypothetical protein